MLVLAVCLAVCAAWPLGCGGWVTSARPLNPDPLLAEAAFV